MLPFYLWTISFPTNHHPQSLDTEKSYCKNFGQVQTISQGKEREEKRKDVCYWERGLEKGMESQWATESWDPWWRQGRHLVLCFLQGYAHMGLCCDASLCSFSCHSLCSSLLFRGNWRSCYTEGRYQCYPFHPLPPARKVCDFAAGAGYQQ